jgi:hypothetical protein
MTFWVGTFKEPHNSEMTRIPSGERPVSTGRCFDVNPGFILVPEMGDMLSVDVTNGT